MLLSWLVLIKKKKSKLFDKRKFAFNVTVCERVWVRSFRPYRVWWSEREVSRVVYHLQEETGSLMTFANAKIKCLISYLLLITPKPPIYRKRPGRTRPERIFSWPILGYSFHWTRSVYFDNFQVGMPHLSLQFHSNRNFRNFGVDHKLKRKPKNAIFSWREITGRWYYALGQPAFF